MRLPIFLFLLCCTATLWAQNPAKKKMTPAVYKLWSTINNPKISNDGLWTTYTLEREGGDKRQCLFSLQENKTYTFERSQEAHFSEDNRYLIFRIRPALDSLRELRRQKIEEHKLPKDTLAIYDLKKHQLETIAQLDSYKLPKKWSGTLAYLLDTAGVNKEEEETEGLLIIRQLNSRQQDSFPYVTNYIFAEEAPRLLFSSNSQDSTFSAGVYYYDCEKREEKTLLTSKGKYQQLCLDKTGKQVAFLANLDTSNNQIRPFELYHWTAQATSAQRIASTTASFLDDQWRISEEGKVHFSKNGEQLFFGIAPYPIFKDTTKLEEEIVEVEVWNYLDKRTYPQQVVDLEQDRKKTYPAVFHLQAKKFAQLGQLTVPKIIIGDEGNAAYALGINEMPYLEKTSWEGFPSYKDLSLVNVANGNTTNIARSLRANPKLSPDGNYAYWYSTPDTAWYAYSVKNQQTLQLTNNQLAPFYDEFNDRPMFPESYDIAGWLKADAAILIYDRYDIWQIDPMNKKAPVRLTKGRENKKVYRYLNTDLEQRFIDPEQAILLHAREEQNKAESYYFLDWKSGQLQLLIQGDFALTRKPLKAKNIDHYLFTKQNFQTFPDLQLAQKNDFQNAKRISQANPQQPEYSWGNIELYEWTAADGQKLQGLLAKPENFDPQKKYPLLVNFYERSSHRLHNHRAPYAHRSTINYTYYTNRGYVIFNPDVPYRVGYPGESALNAVVSGIGALVDDGFIDADRIGVQGHSWGGYQVAHLLTKTNIFKCAESGAPVVNMFSAYGGIRWGSGLSRMFQYEHTQSRIGGTIWEYPLRYLENSPLFALDKVETPVLILHNDKDGAVPWYQGIEYFMGLRRLGKPAWMLNYNGEPHWPVKLQNRLDFNLRMQQFFDHYLMEEPMPKWMEKGVSALEKGE